jgi:2-polyprenyl-3-methyl-5-hydroxy-6-metoxy-1,4-benzoquinol methylase
LSETPFWRLLGNDLHMHTLDQGYAPSGLLEMIIAPPKRVLDVGCFCGGTGRWLKDKFVDCEVIGIEPLYPAAEKAAVIYDRIINKPFEGIVFTDEELSPGSFDAIIVADVLEHMVNPWIALERLNPLLGPEGCLYASIPNVRNLGVLQQLAEGKWLYEGSGILDISHLRFFTRAQIIEMFDQTGWDVSEIRINPSPQLSEIFKGYDLSTINTIEAGPLVLRNLTHQDVLELIALQFFIRACPKK